MKVTGLNGREYHLDLKKYRSKRGKRSKYHLRARDIIEKVYSGFNILEEVKLPGSVNPAKKSVLYLDFLIPDCRIGFEVHGQQHYEYTPFFHKSRAGFMYAKARDRDKVAWCEINDIKLIELKWSDPEEYWREQIGRTS